MFNLVLKDLSITKGTFPVVLILCFTNNMFFINAPAFIYIIVPPLIAYEYFKNSCGNDYKYNSNIMFSSLPINRREVVLSKYIESIIFLIFAIICTIIFTYVFRRIGISGLGGVAFIHLSKFMHLDDFSKLMNFKSIIMYSLLSTILFISIYFPIYFKLEYLKVRNFFALVSLLICFIPILFLYIIGIENVYNIIKYFSGIPGTIANVAIIGILLIILYTSVNISIKYYENKDLIL
ncbi:ABC-2 transporter permease [Clostridium estertheticum]|uniref:ABC-2 transporter permease n=1 Tax=Clostridium estertheticum TaxID=238834 RepID=A0A5N7INM4_9CLOT|nr:ABC-2 transporter permease [Clostridium estertheticum]MPQ31846.1 ABC-2 transporter permease [Clostridium estertheticum]MPQ62513.1 ABC-2 transporter permease [Clostridium estertheticum]